MKPTTNSLTSIKSHGTKPQKSQRYFSTFVSVLHRFSTSMNYCQIPILITNLIPLDDHNQWLVNHDYKTKSAK